MAAFAYLFERFPARTQTFCFREVEEMLRQKMEPLVLSIRPPEEDSAFAPELQGRVHYAPPDAELRARVKELAKRDKLPVRMRGVLKLWGRKGDKMRLYEAHHLGALLHRRGIRHVHAHFAGMAARTAFWIKKFYNIGYSFTGHANDIFCETDFPVSLEDLVREARFVVTETDFSRGWLREKFPAHGWKIHRVYNGIHVGKFPPASFGDGVPKIVSVGRLIEKKGFADLIAACAILKREGVPFYCRIIGAGPLEAELRALILGHGLGHDVALEGARREEEVMRFLRGARVFALACTRERDGGMDNLPTVIVEAMACGLPVVSTRLAGIPEMIVENETGRLTRENDPAALAKALREILLDGALAQRLGQRARELAVERFSTETTVRALKHLLIRHGRVLPPPRALALEPGLALRVARRWICGA